MKMLSVVAVLCSCVQETKAANKFLALDSDSDSDSDSMATASNSDPMAGNSDPMMVDSGASTCADSGGEAGYEKPRKKKNAHAKPAAVPAAVPPAACFQQPVLKMRFECDLPQGGQYSPKVHGLWMLHSGMEDENCLPDYMKNTAGDAWGRFHNSTAGGFRKNKWLWRGTHYNADPNVAQLMHMSTEWKRHGQYVVHYLDGSDRGKRGASRVNRYFNLMEVFQNTVRFRPEFNTEANKCGTWGHNYFAFCGHHVRGTDFNIVECPE